MESPATSRTGEIASHLSMIFVSVASLIFFAFFYEYIAWYTTESDGSVTRLSMLTDDYFKWLPIPTIAAILAIAAFTVMIFYDRYWFRITAQIVLNIVGIAVTLSLVAIFPFDFSVIPNATAVDVVPKVVTAFFIFMAVVYGVTATVLFVRLRRHTAKGCPDVPHSVSGVQ